MKKNILFKSAAVLTMLMLALVITVVPGTALAAISGVTITTTGGASYNIPVGGTVELNAVPTGTIDGTRTNVWGVDPGGANVSLSSTSADSTTVTGVTPGDATVKITLTDSATGTPYSATANIKVLAMYMPDAITLDGGSSRTLTVSDVPASSTTTWSSSRNEVATVNASGLVQAVGAGTAVITAANSTGQTKTCTVTVNPIITITPSSQNITAANTSVSIQLKVEYGGDLIGPLSSVSWTNSNATAGTLTSAPTSFTVVNPTTMTCTATFTSNSTGTNASTEVKAQIAGSGSYSASKTSTVNVRTARYLTLEGDATLNKSDRYGDYTLTLHEANGSVVNDDTSTVHWSWSSSYLSVSSAALNDSRAVMTDGVAKIQLYARYNTSSSGTRVYAWINSDSGNKVYIPVVISGLSSLPQTGQDMTLIYVLGGSAAALLAVAGVWYGIRKKRTIA